MLIFAAIVTNVMKMKLGADEISQSDSGCNDVQCSTDQENETAIAPARRVFKQAKRRGGWRPDTNQGCWNLGISAGMNNGSVYKYSNKMCCTS